MALQLGHVLAAGQLAARQGALAETWRAMRIAVEATHGASCQVSLDEAAALLCVGQVFFLQMTYVSRKLAQVRSQKGAFTRHAQQVVSGVAAE